MINPQALPLSFRFWALLLLVSAWSSQEATATAPKKRVLCSTTQIADFTRQIVGDRCRVDCVLAPGQDPHMYEVTPADAKMVQTADLCIDNGLHLEGGDWLRVLAEDIGKPIVSCTDQIEPLMAEESGVDHRVPDPHAWFNVANARHYVRAIYVAVSELDPEHSWEYEARAQLCLDQLRTLDAWIRRQLNVIPPDRRVLVTSHDAFNYFCAAYGFKSAAPLGWSTQEVGAELTPNRRREVIETIRKFGVRAVFVETSVNAETLQEIARDAGARIGGKLYSDSMGAPGTAGETYNGMMRENVLTIVSALRETE